jgi:hypothetical protein
MDFTARKLPREAAPNLRRCPIDSIVPYALMLAPMYVYMPRNEKFVSVKAPLDFFTPEELAKLRSFESFFATEFVDQALPYRDAARVVKRLLTWNPEALPASERASALPPAPYELSDATIRALGPLWGAQGVIDPFFVAVFANELCPLLPTEELTAARDQSVPRFECALYRASWVVFTALHLGQCDLDYLFEARNHAFRAAMGWGWHERLLGVRELIDFSARVLPDADVSWIRLDRLRAAGGHLAGRLTSRLERVAAALIRPADPLRSTRGPQGFLAAGVDEGSGVAGG